MKLIKINEVGFIYMVPDDIYFPNTVRVNSNMIHVPLRCIQFTRFQLDLFKLNHINPNIIQLNQFNHLMALVKKLSINTQQTLILNKCRWTEK